MKPDFSGEYILNRDASALGPAASAIVAARLRLTHNDPRFSGSARFASDDDAVEFTFDRFTDGRAAASNGMRRLDASGTRTRSSPKTASAPETRP